MRRVHFAFALLAATLPSAAQTGPLRVLKSNPRYFTDDSGKAIYLAGSHTWNNFQDTGHRVAQSGEAAPPFDYTAYLDFLQAHHHNFFRLWRWEVPKWTDEKPPGVKTSGPHPWPRTGPGTANDGLPRFDLDRFNTLYFDRLRARIIAARDRHMYVSVMLFEGWAAQFTDAWTYHPFKLENNANGIDADRMGYYMAQDTEMGRKIRALQENYVRKVVDTVNDLDNVLYEICNESGPWSTGWQYDMIRFVKEYEASKPKQHPVGMTVQYSAGLNSTVFNSPADWVSPNPGGVDENYLRNPSGAYRGKVIVNDTDHLLGHTGGDSLWVWESFCRGLNILFMEQLTPSPTWQDSARAAMGQTRQYAERIDLASMTPHDALAETGYCLANPGKEYVVFQPGNKGEFWVNLADAPGPFAVEWLNVNTGAVQKGGSAQGSERRAFITPFGGPAVLYLKATTGL